MTTAPGSPPAAAVPAHLAGRDIAGLLFVADMYGVQLDQLAAVLGVGEPRARAIASSWRRARYTQSARLGPGGPWTWLTRAGLAACGLPFPATIPALSRLAHLRAVTARARDSPTPSTAASWSSCTPYMSATNSSPAMSRPARCAGAGTPAGWPEAVVTN